MPARSCGWIVIPSRQPVRRDLQRRGETHERPPLGLTYPIVFGVDDGIERHASLARQGFDGEAARQSRSAQPLAGTLIDELQNFRVVIDPKTAHDSYSAWRENQHDDLVLAVALAVWWRDRVHRRLDDMRLQQPRAPVIGGAADTFAYGPAARRAG